MSHDHQVLVVIGIGGMGELIARRQGAGGEGRRPRTIVADVDPEAVERVVTAMRSDGYDVEGAAVDVSSRESLQALAEQARSRGHVRQVVHTAGLSPVQASTEAILAVDALGVAYSLDVFGEVIDAGGAGVIIASMAGTMAAGLAPEVEAVLRTTPSDRLLDHPALAPAALGDPGAAYALAKRTNQLRVQAASLRWGAHGARINSLSPGVITTPMGEQELAGASGAQMRAMIDRSGTGRPGSPADIAAAVSFLLGSDADFITGTDLLVDGGVVAAIRSDMPTDPGR